MKMLYGDQEYDVKLRMPKNGTMNLIMKMKDGVLEETDPDLLTEIVKSIDGIPIEEYDDGEVGWSALFAGMEVLGRVAQKKSAANGAGPR